MPQAPADKTYFTFVGGINTEASPLLFPENASLDEENFDLEIDGSRRRRRGLDDEASGVVLSSQTLLSSDAMVSHKWRNVGGDPLRNFIVLQIGGILHFYEDTSPVTGNKKQFTIDLTNKKIDAAKDYQVTSSAVDCAHGRGHLFVVGKYIDPFYVEFTASEITINNGAGYSTGTGQTITVDAIPDDLPSGSVITFQSGGIFTLTSGASATDTTLTGDLTVAAVVDNETGIADEGRIESNTISITERDFEGIDDGIESDASPAASSAAHTYNLKNRGWLAADITTYDSDNSVQPAKNMIPHKGYGVIIDGTGASGEFADGYGVQEFSSGKIASQLFGKQSAPQGHFFVDPFDKTEGVDSDSPSVAITADWTTDWTGGNTVTINTDAVHGITAASGEEVTISGNRFYYWWQNVGVEVLDDTLDGTYTEGVDLTVTDTDTFTITYNSPGGFHSWADQYRKVGQIGNDPVSNPEGYVVNVRPTCVAFYSGRLIFGGIEHPKLTNKIFYTQLIERDDQYGRCYQEADPTSQHLSELVATDGGTIPVIGMGNLQAFMEFGNSLLLLSDEGIYQINGGGRPFAANNYQVSLLADLDVAGRFTHAVMDNVPVFWATQGIYIVQQDPRTGFLYTESITNKTIETLYSQITNKSKVRRAWDGARKRCMWMYDSDDDGILDKILIFSTKLGAFYKYSIPNASTSYAGAITSLREYDDPDDPKKIKIFRVNTLNDEAYCVDFDQSDYTDWDGNIRQAYLLTGYETMGDAMRFKQAPVAHIYMGKTETGYTATAATNTSSLKLKARYDFTDHANSGKITTEQECYRRGRYYVPSGSGDLDDGYPIIVSRLKLRGRGRAIHLHFYTPANSTDDAWIYGWALHYKKTRRI